MPGCPVDSNIDLNFRTSAAIDSKPFKNLPDVVDCMAMRVSCSTSTTNPIHLGDHAGQPGESPCQHPAERRTSLPRAGQCSAPIDQIGSHQDRRALATAQTSPRMNRSKPRSLDCGYGVDHQATGIISNAFENNNNKAKAKQTTMVS